MKKLKIKPQILFDDEGKKSGVILKFKEFDELMEQLADLKSLCTVYQRTKKPLQTVAFEEAMKRVFGDDI
jgi:hypothetical protein